MRTFRFVLFEDSLGFAYAVVRDGLLVALSHYPTADEAIRGRERHWPDAELDPDAPPFPELRRQLDEYLAGRRRTFELPLAPSGTDFQKRCWQALQEIPFGQTRSYGDQARIVGQPGAARAVGRANHDNPIGVVIPCHRVIGANGSLTGYAGGLHMKRRLLELEGVLQPSLEL
ncbi:MAG TPA: methylated-DNA--[protein]-cysteine S-methyltransferase [Thermoanaerobaculia bacterium]|nr:methylated-DNA--[protein]-cysteine S-methyltransferase [Thermoanaerobaculia bacterium]